MTGEQLYQSDLQQTINSESDSPYVLRVPTDIRGTTYRVFTVAWTDLPRMVRWHYLKKATNP